MLKMKQDPVKCRRRTNAFLLSVFLALFVVFLMLAELRDWWPVGPLLLDPRNLWPGGLFMVIPWYPLPDVGGWHLLFMCVLFLCYCGCCVWFLFLSLLRLLSEGVPSPLCRLTHQLWSK